MTASGISAWNILLLKEFLLNSEPISVNNTTLHTYEMLYCPNRKIGKSWLKWRKLSGGIMPDKTHGYFCMKPNGALPQYH